MKLLPGKLLFLFFSSVIAFVTLAEDHITVLTAKKVITMDALYPEATAVAIRGDRIIAVGDEKSMQSWLKDKKVVVDDRYKDHVLFPGLVEPHLHPLLGALQLNTTWITPENWQVLEQQVEATRTPEQYWQRLKQAIKDDEKNDTPIFISWGWSKPEHGPMTKAMLDKLDTDKPIMIWQRSTHEAIYNSAALEWMKFDPSKLADKYKDVIDVENGHFIEAGFFEVAVPLLASYLLSPEFIDSSFDKLNQYIIGNGITTLADMAFGAVNWDMEIANYQRNLVEKKVPFRTVLVPDAYKMSLQKDGLDPSFTFLDNFLGKPSDTPYIVRGRRVKMFSDGAIFSQLMQMNEPGYIDGHQGQWITPPKDFLTQARKYWQQGYRIHVHSNGDKGIDNTLNVLQTVQLEHPRPPHNFIVEHLGFANERILRRIKDLGAAVSANPYYMHFLGDSLSDSGLGADRAQKLVPLAGLIDMQVPVSLHSDFGMAPAQPLALAWAAATRETMGGSVKVPPRALTVDEALRAITVDAAYILDMEDDIGSIEAGKKADFVVLDKNPYDVGAKKLNEIKIIATVFEGDLD